MPRQHRQQWLDIEFRANSAFDHHTGQQHGGYWIEWEDPQVSVELTEEQLRALMTEAMMAQAQAATAAS